MGLTLSSRGRGCESLILASQTAVALVKVPSAVQFIPGGKIVKKKGPCDFVGLVRGTSRMVILDAKECDLRLRFPVGNKDHVPEHQREQLVHFGQLGALAGLLVESTAHGRLHWLPWRMLIDAPPSYPWEAIPEVGPASRLIDWARVFAADAARDGKAQVRP